MAEELACVVVMRGRKSFCTTHEVELIPVQEAKARGLALDQPGLGVVCPVSGRLFSGNPDGDELYDELENGSIIGSHCTPSLRGTFEPMRETSPATGVSVDEWLAYAPSSTRGIVARIRHEKQLGMRRLPSASLVDRSALLASEVRNRLLDAVASLVDENYAGRGEMCIQFADLLNRALNKLSFPARAVMGAAIYYDTKGNEIFRWKHAWVRLGDEVVDGNVDSISENPLVPSSVRVAPYWGPIQGMPSDRRLQEHRSESIPPDEDVEQLWWPDLSKIVDESVAS